MRRKSEFIKDCLHCGKPFRKPSKESIERWNTTIKYCSTACYRQANQTKSYTCPTCGKQFSSKCWSAKAKFCSRKCSSVSQIKPLPVCEVCGKECSKHSRRFCSAPCKIAWYKGDKVYNFVGENFRKDAYPVDYSFWTNLSQEIRRRDEVCQHCGKTPKENGRALDIHHIVPYRISKDNSPKNLVALCRACHKKADWKVAPGYEVAPIMAKRQSPKNWV